MKRKALLVAVFVLVNTGCATSNLNYVPPTITEIENQIVLGDPSDEVWDRLVKNLASDIFVINSIDKSSSIINVSYSSNTPTDWISCGVSVREFSDTRGRQVYEYDPSSSTRYTFTDDVGRTFNAERNTRLNGRANIYVAHSGDGGATVTVDTTYVVEGTLSYSDAYGVDVGGENFSFDFSTKQPQVIDDGVTCIAKGNLEDKILHYAR